MTGFCDWNIVLDSIGGPNHVGNFCGAEVMVDYRNDRIYYTPYYYVLKQFSRSMRPGDIVLKVESPKTASLKEESQIYLCATVNAEGQYAINILNTGDAVTVPVQIGEYVARVDMPANSVKTILVKL